MTRRKSGVVSRLFSVTIGVAAGGYCAYVAWTFYRFGKAERSHSDEAPEELIDTVMPTYAVREHHEVSVASPAAVAFNAACGVDLGRSRLIQSIFRTRELLLGGQVSDVFSVTALTDQAKMWGWRVIAEEPDHEIVFGAVTQPWVAHPVFEGLPADEFRRFERPFYIKIAWSLAAHAVGTQRSVLSTETRVQPTDAEARSKFRLYWAFLSPGILLIRRIALALAKREAEVKMLPDRRNS